MPRASRAVPEHEDHGLAVSQPTFSNLEDLVRNGRRLVKDVEACTVRSMLACERFAVVFLGTCRRTEPRVLVVVLVHAIARNSKPMPRETQLRPTLKRRPRLRL